MRNRFSYVEGVPIEEPRIINVLCEHCVRSAWLWLLAHTTPRPIEPDDICIWHFRIWIDGCQIIDMHLDEYSPMILARLYLISQFIGDIEPIIRLTKGEDFPEISVIIPLDKDVASVVRSERRFRNALSEVIAFWVRISTIIKCGNVSEYSSSLPNFQPEDKGPDGLSIVLSEDQINIEVHSVKNSINNPQQLISSAAFRKGENPKKKKLLDDFHLLEKKNIGFGRLDRTLAEVYRSLNSSPEQSIRYGLLAKSHYNAVVVADDQHADPSLFVGYHRLRQLPNERIATYISATNWKELAEITRQCVLRTFSDAGVI